MPSPFPGMDPYLEAPWLWPDVHHELISVIRTALSPRLRPTYAARVEMRVYITNEEDPGRHLIVPDVRVEAVPKRNGNGRKKPASTLAVSEPLVVSWPLEVEVEEAFIKIIDVKSEDLVTVIEVLSPANKFAGAEGRDSFIKKRNEILSTNVNWVEIDLLRAGLPWLPSPPTVASDYRVYVSRGEDRVRRRYWPINLRDPLPVIGIPLRGDDPDAPLDLGAVLRTGYDNAGYDLSLDYSKPPTPPLNGSDAKWARELLRGKK